MTKPTQTKKCVGGIFAKLPPELSQYRHPRGLHVRKVGEERSQPCRSVFGVLAFSVICLHCKNQAPILRVAIYTYYM